MNFDPYDSAAWRTFDMLDAEESALFDEAMRQDPVLQGAYFEMDRLCAAIAATLSVPTEPKAGQLDRLLSRLGLVTSRRSHFRLALAGWVTTLVLGVLLALHLTGIIDRWDNAATASHGAAVPPPGADTPPKPSSNKNSATAGNPAEPGAGMAGKEPEVKSAVKVETKRLNQEIEVLRENLEKFQHRDRVLFEAVPGVALPIVMTMNPPGVGLEDPATLAKNEEHVSITALLGDALTTLTGAAAAMPLDPAAERLADVGGFPKHPTAIPIYDSARDSGTMVVSNLPPAAEGEVYNLWVTTAASGRPIYVGSLPESSASGADSFDFSLGSTLVLPSGFVLTRDPQNAPASPTEANTVLQGPPVPAP